MNLRKIMVILTAIAAPLSAHASEEQIPNITKASSRTAVNVDPQLGYGPILSGERTINSDIWVKDITKVIEFFFDPSADRAKVISGLNAINAKGNLFATNSLLDLTDFTFSLQLSKGSREILSGCELGSAGFPTCDQCVAMTLFPKSFSDKWKLNPDKLKELFPKLKFGHMIDTQNLIQRDSQLPNNLLVTPDGSFMMQFILFPFK